MEDKCN